MILDTAVTIPCQPSLDLVQTVDVATQCATITMSPQPESPSSVQCFVKLALAPDSEMLGHILQYNRSVGNTVIHENENEYVEMIRFQSPISI